MSDPIQEYPKMITTPDGVQVTVTSADDEYRWTHPPKPDAPVTVPVDVPTDADMVAAETVDADALAEPSGPLEDVTLEMDNPDFDPPKKTKTAAKKK